MDTTKGLKRIDYAIIFTIGVLVLIIIFTDEHNETHETPLTTTTTSTPQTTTLKHITIETTTITQQPATTTTFKATVPVRRNITPTTTEPPTTTTTQPAAITQCLETTVIEKLTNIRPAGGQTPIYQAGYFQAKKDMLVAAGIKPNKYNEGPSTSTWTVQGNISSEEYCFKKASGSDYGLNGLKHNSGFLLNVSMWKWMPFNINEEYSNITYTYNSITNKTTAKNNFWNVTVATDNLWIQRL